MKKQIIALFALALVCMPSFAKEKCDGKCADCSSCKESKTVLASTIGKNWEVSASLGAQCFLSEEVETMTHAKVWAFPSIYVDVNKWISPVWGLGIGVNYGKIKNGYLSSECPAALFASYSDEAMRTDNGGLGFLAEGYAFNAFIRANLDFTNLFGGYRERVFNLIGYLGGGLVIPFGNLGDFTDNRKVSPTVNMGLIGRFNIAKRWAIDLGVRSAFVADNFNGTCYENTGVDQIPFDVLASATLGVTYKFGFTQLKNHTTGELTEKMYWVPLSTAIACSQTLKDATDAAAAEGNAKAAAAEAKAKAAEDALAKAKADAAAEIARLKAMEPKAIDLDYWQLVNFKINRAELSNREKVAIKSAAEVISNFPDKKIVVNGFCDKQTGNKSYNDALSQKRANVVKDYLVNECGIDANRIEVVANGGVDYMYFKDKQCSRSAVIAIAK